jgi:iron complex outermembrane receptor protein
MVKTTRRALLLSGAAIVTFARPVLAAQEGTNPPGGPKLDTLEQVIVTAQRRQERAQDVPIVISAFSNERLQELNVTEPQDLYGTVPSLVSGNQGQATRDVQSYSIRGQSTGFLASPGVQLYMSEVPLPSSVSLNLQGAPGMFVDLENVQVLSGPQGTLFGRNTTGGAVLFQPRKPSNDFEGYIEASAGSYDLEGVEGALNIPVISDVLMVRLVGAYQDRRGFTKDLVWNKWRDDVHWKSGRIGITFKPTDKLQNYLVAYGSDSSNNGAGHIHGQFNIPGLLGRQSCTEGTPVPGVIASCDVYRRQTAIAEEIGPRRTRGDLDGYSEIESWGAINTTSYDLTDELTLRNIISYQKLKDNYATDQDGTPLQQYELSQGAPVPNFPIPGFADEFGLPRTPGNVYLNGAPSTLPRDYLEQFTEELQLLGTMLDNHLTFAVGGFYYEAKPAGLWGNRSVQFCAAEVTGGACAGTAGRAGVTNESQALYGQGTLDFGAVTPALETLRLTAGYRYTWDTIEGFSSSWAPLGAFGNFCVFGPPAGTIAPASADPAVACNFGAKLESTAATWTVGLDYRPISDLLVYGKVSKGYKAGGFNTFAVRAETQTFKPEDLTTYEAGFKSDWRLGGSIPVRFNATYYYSEYENIQRPGGDFNLANGAGGAAIFSAEATIKGFEVEASIRPIDAIEIGTTVSHADGEYKKYETLSFGGAACNGVVPFGGTADFSCAPFQFLTPWIYNVYATIQLPMPEDMGELSLFTSYSHLDEQYSAPGPFEPGAMIEGYELLNATLSWNDVARSGVDISAFANNISDKVYRTSNANSFSGNLVLSTLYGEPRMYGVKVRYRFGQ